MSSKFRRDGLTRQYTERTFIRRVLSIGLVSLLIITCVATLVAFYIMINYQVVQSIEIGYVKNYSIRSKTLAQLKKSQLEMSGHDLLISAELLSELVSSSQSGLIDQTFVD